MIGQDGLNDRISGGGPVPGAVPEKEDAQGIVRLGGEQDRGRDRD
jgi:hypothetical protein